jgi:hypothetical protein
MREASDQLAQVDLVIEKSRQMGFTWPGTIAVSELLPEQGEVVQAYTSNADCWTGAYFDGKAWWAFTTEGHGEIFGVTHWLPLPPQPE